MLIRKRFLNTKVKILTGIMIAGLVVSGSLLTLPTVQAKNTVSDDYPLMIASTGIKSLFGVMNLMARH